MQQCVTSLHTNENWDFVSNDPLNCVRITNADITPGILPCPCPCRAPQKVLFTPQLECRFLCRTLKQLHTPLDRCQQQLGIMHCQDFYHKYYSSGPLRSETSFWVMYTTRCGFPSSRKCIYSLYAVRAGSWLFGSFQKAGPGKLCVAMWLHIT